MAFKFNPTTGCLDMVGVSSLDCTEDVDYIILSFGGTNLLKIRKTDGQLLIRGELDVLQTL